MLPESFWPLVVRRWLRPQDKQLTEHPADHVGIEPDIVTALPRPALPRRTKILQKALQHFGDVPHPGIKFTIVTYSALSGACAKGADLQKALQLLGDFLCRGIKLNVVFHSTFTSA